MLEGPLAAGKEIARTSSGGRDRSFSRARRGSERHQAGAAGRGEPPAACNVAIGGGWGGGGGGGGAHLAGIRAVTYWYTRLRRQATGADRRPSRCVYAGGRTWT